MFGWRGGLWGSALCLMALTWRQCQAFIKPGPFLSCATSCISSVSNKFHKYNNWDAVVWVGTGEEVHCDYSFWLLSLGDNVKPFYYVAFQASIRFRLNSTRITRWIEMQKLQERCLGGQEVHCDIVTALTWRQCQASLPCKECKSMQQKAFWQKKHLFQTGNFSNFHTLNSFSLWIKQQHWTYMLSCTFEWR